MAPHLTGSQTVFLAPGTFGSYAMAQIVRDLGNTAEVAWAETGTLRTWRASMRARSQHHRARGSSAHRRLSRARQTRRSPSSAPPIRASTGAATPSRRR
jgi:hypothetical protein